MSHVESVFQAFAETHKPAETFYVCLVEDTTRQEIIDGERLTLRRRTIKRSLDFATYGEAKECESKMRSDLTPDDFQISDTTSLRVMVLDDREKGLIEFSSELNSDHIIGCERIAG